MLILALSLICLVAAVPLHGSQEESRALQVSIDGTLTTFSVGKHNDNEVEVLARQFCLERDIHPLQECTRDLAERWHLVHNHVAVEEKKQAPPPETRTIDVAVGEDKFLFHYTLILDKPNKRSILDQAESF